MSSNPYACLGLARNPFVAKDNLNHAAEIWMDRGYSTAPQPHGRQLVQILGDKGFGKTSHLKHWRSQTGGSYCYYPPDWGRFKLPIIEKITYWDEGDRIPLPLLLLALFWATLQGSTIVVGTHRDLGKLARFFRLQVTTIELPPVDAQTLQTWANLEIAAVRLPDQDCGLFLAWADMVAIAEKSKGSWRTAEDYLHIWAATMTKKTQQNDSFSRNPANIAINYTSQNPLYP